MNLRASFQYAAALLVLFGTAVNGRAQAQKNSPEAATLSGSESTYRGGLVSPPLPKPKFTLTDTSGAAFHFAQKTEGYVTLLFFGYTHCPDVCPLQMSIIAQAFKKIPPALANQFKVVFVTTDPERDSPPVLHSWLNHVDKR
jgi:protein SCO1/2